jgi:hypothetical protein
VSRSKLEATARRKEKERANVQQQYLKQHKLDFDNDGDEALRLPHQA